MHIMLCRISVMQLLNLYDTCTSCRFNYDPAVAVPQKYYQEPEVAGRNRYRYFRRPIIPFLPQMPPNVVLAPTR